MRATHTEVDVHIVWATWDRLPVLLPAWKQPVLACIQAECVALGGEVLALNAMPDHVHLLVELPATVSLATLVKQVKGASSHLVTHQLAPGEWFKWQGAYGAFSVSPSAVPDVSRYIQQQEEHHRDKTMIAEWEAGD